MKLNTSTMTKKSNLPAAWLGVVLAAASFFALQAQGQAVDQAKIAAAEQTATAAAESKLDDAQTTRSDTAGMSAQADHLEQLADVEKQKRQSERAKDA